MRGLWRIRSLQETIQNRWRRLHRVSAYYRGTVGLVWRWLRESREFTNFTYDLTPLNLSHLTALLAHVTRSSFHTVEEYVREIVEDEDLRSHIKRVTIETGQDDDADPEARYGRRVGWYALTRILKPRIVVETGVDKGLGSCVLCAALLRNRAEGQPGHLYATDISPSAGWLLKPPYSECGTILRGDSIASLSAFDDTIDLFINDSNHAADYEAREYQAIERKLSPGAFILGDNAHVTDALLKFARRTGRGFLFFAEKPLDHWYPGGGMGIAFPDRSWESPAATDDQDQTP